MGSEKNHRAATRPCALAACARFVGPRRHCDGRRMSLRRQPVASASPNPRCRFTTNCAPYESGPSPGPGPFRNHSAAMASAFLPKGNRDGDRKQNYKDISRIQQQSLQRRRAAMMNDKPGNGPTVPASRKSINWNLAVKRDHDSAKRHKGVVRPIKNVQ